MNNCTPTEFREMYDPDETGGVGECEWIEKMIKGKFVLVF